MVPKTTPQETNAPTTTARRRCPQAAQCAGAVGALSTTRREVERPTARPRRAALTVHEGLALLAELSRLLGHVGIEDAQLVQLIEVQPRRAQRRLRHRPAGRDGTYGPSRLPQRPEEALLGGGGREKVLPGGGGREEVLPDCGGRQKALPSRSGARRK